MSNGVKNMILRHRGLISYTVLNYIDKAVTFVVPLIVLYLFGNRALYNEVEYIFSIGAVAAVLIDLGVSSYFLYAYRSADDKVALVNQVEAHFHLLFVLWSGIGLLLLIASMILDVQSPELLLFVVIRSLGLFLVSFYANYFRLSDVPARIFGLTLLVNLTTILILVLVATSASRLHLWHFFLAQALLVGGAIIHVFRSHRRTTIPRLMEYLRGALVYAWPVVLNVFVFMFVNNYGKVYARNALSEGEMFHISFVQRLCLIIQLAHSSSVAYLTKRVFDDESGRINPRVFLLYLLMLGSGLVLLAIAFEVVREFSATADLPIDWLTICLVGYTILWCLGAFFEMYLNRMNQNRYVLLFGLVTGLSFFVILESLPFEPLVNIAGAMCISMALNVVLILYFLFRRGVVGA
ncbi:MAG: hypothetical protein AAB305_06715 [Candidatus Zixiibacteriota bacterium]